MKNLATFLKKFAKKILKNSFEVDYQTQKRPRFNPGSTHYNKQLLDAFPYEEGKKCQLCVDAGRTNPLIAKSKSRHINHVGSLHEKVLDMLPSKLSLSFNNSRKSTLRQSAKAGGFEEEQPVYNNLNTGPQLKNFRGPVPGPPME